MLKMRQLDKAQDVPIGIPIVLISLSSQHPSSPCSIQFCDFYLFLLKICFIECPDTIRIFKIHIDCWTRGIQPCLIIFKKQKPKISKNHSSISKLGAFNPASFIFQKKWKRSSSSSFQEKKKQDFQKSCINF